MNITICDDDRAICGFFEEKIKAVFQNADIGNHLATLEALYATGKITAAEEYRKELKQKLWLADNEVKSGNPVTDVILSERKQEAQEEGIEHLILHGSDQQG